MGNLKYEKNQFRLFSEAAEKYKQEKRQIVSDYEGMGKGIGNLLPYIGHLQIIDVDNDALGGFKEDRLAGCGSFKRGAAAGTVNKELAFVTAILNRACRLWRWLRSAPLILPVEGPKAAPYVLDRAQQDALLRRLPGYLSRAYLFDVNTGIRQQELHDLDWRNEVRHDDLMGFILRKTKNGQQRFCVCNSIAKSIVEGQRGKHPTRVFTNREGSGGIRKSVARYHWITAWGEAGLPSDPFVLKGVHNLRHTYGHRLRACGVSEEDVGTLLGHHNANITSHYSQPDIERLTMLSERVVERRETVILRAVSATG